MVLGRQVAGEHPRRRRAQRAGNEHVEDGRKPPRRARRLDPIDGGVFGQPQDLHAVLEGGAEPGRGVEPAGVEFGEVGNQGHRRLALAVSETAEHMDKLGVSEVGRGAHCLHDTVHITRIGQTWTVCP